METLALLHSAKAWTAPSEKVRGSPYSPTFVPEEADLCARVQCSSWLRTVPNGRRRGTRRVNVVVASRAMGSSNFFVAH